MNRRFLAAVVGSMLVAGCATTTDESYAVPALHKQAAFDLNCPENQLQIREIGQDKYGVEGCNRRASYQLRSCDTMTHECTFAPAQPAGSY